MNYHDYSNRYISRKEAFYHKTSLPDYSNSRTDQNRVKPYTPEPAHNKQDDDAPPIFLKNLRFAALYDTKMHLRHIFPAGCMHQPD